MEILFQIINSIFVLLAIYQKKKWKMMAFFTLNNLILVVMYLLFARTTSAYVCIVAMLRTMVFGIYAFKNIKPNWIWLCVFEFAFIFITIYTWQDAYDLLIMFSFIFMCFGSWQDKQLVLRITYIFGYTLSATYKAIIGAYIAMGVDIVSLISVIICLVYYCILKREEPIFDKIVSKFKRKKDIYKV